MKRIKATKLKNKTIVQCTDTNTTVKGTIVQKTNTRLVVDLPTGFQMVLDKSDNRRLYTWRAGGLEFISDGWEQT